MGILPLSHFNRQDKLRSREVKPDAGSHMAGRWPRWDSYPDVSDSRFRGCSPSQTERGHTKQGFHVFGRMQPGGCLWAGSGLAGPHTKRPRRQRQCTRASSVSPGHSWAMRSHPQWLGKVPGNLPKRQLSPNADSPTPALHHQSGFQIIHLGCSPF